MLVLVSQIEQYWCIDNLSIWGNALAEVSFNFDSACWYNWTLTEWTEFLWLLILKKSKIRGPYIKLQYRMYSVGFCKSMSSLFLNLWAWKYKKWWILSFISCTPQFLPFDINIGVSKCIKLNQGQRIAAICDRIRTSCGMEKDNFKEFASAA